MKGMTVSVMERTNLNMAEYEQGNKDDEVYNKQIFGEL